MRRSIKQPLSLYENDKIDPYKFIVGMNDDKNVKMSDYTIPHSDHITLYDFSIANLHEEDKLFRSNKWYRLHLRRGNTIIQIFDNDDEDMVKDTIFGRKGLMKFFELKLDYILYNLNEYDSKLYEYQQYEIIFSDIKKSIKDGHKISIYKIKQLDGETAHISWIPKLESWMIASKNTSLLAECRDDLKKYNSIRFNIPRLIGDAWFNIIDIISKQGKLSQLKADLVNKTLIGEYYGNFMYQQVIRYTEEKLEFYAIVENDRIETCISPSVAYILFAKYGIPAVINEKIGIFDDWIKLNQTLRIIYETIKNGNIDTDQEGYVLYFVKLNKHNNNNEQVISLTKIKTLVYKIYRTLKEKLRFVFQKSTSLQDKLQKDNLYKTYCENIKNMCNNENQLAFLDSLEYYFDIAKVAFDYSMNNPRKSYLIQEQFVSFISVLLYCKDKGIAVNPIMFQYKNMQQLLKTPWSTYKTGISQKSKILKDIQPKLRDVYIILPIGIPGLGESFVIQQMEKIIPKEIYLSSISSDQVRKECMDKIAKRQPNLSTKVLYEESKKTALELFRERLGELIYYSNKLEFDTHMIFVDKNHPPNSWKGTFRTIEENSKHLNLKKVALFPEIKNPFKYISYSGKEITFPFSLTLFLNCVNRVLNRLDHETLKGSPIEKAVVVFKFLNMYRGVKLNEDNVKSNGFDMIFTIPYASESDDADQKISLKLRENIINALEYQHNVDNETDPKLFELIGEFLKEMPKCNIDYNYPEERIIQKCTTFLTKIANSEKGQLKKSIFQIIKDEEESKIQQLCFILRI